MEVPPRTHLLRCQAHLRRSPTTFHQNPGSWGCGKGWGSGSGMAYSHLAVTPISASVFPYCKRAECALNLVPSSHLFVFLFKRQSNTEKRGREKDIASADSLPQMVATVGLDPGARSPVWSPTWMAGTYALQLLSRCILKKLSQKQSSQDSSQDSNVEYWHASSCFTNCTTTLAPKSFLFFLCTF